MKNLNINFALILNKKKNLKFIINITKFVLLISGLYALSFLIWLILQIAITNKSDMNINIPSNQNADQFIVNNAPFGTFKIVESVVAITVPVVIFADHIKLSGIFADNKGAGFAIFNINGKSIFANTNSEVESNVLLFKVSAQSVILKSSNSDSTKEIFLDGANSNPVIDSNVARSVTPTSSADEVKQPIVTTSSASTTTPVQEVPQVAPTPTPTPMVTPTITAVAPPIINDDTPKTPEDYRNPENRKKYIEQLKSSIQ